MNDLINFKEYYYKHIKPEFKQEGNFNINNIHQVPAIVKIVINMGVGEAATDSKVIAHAVSNLTAIAGQKAVVTKAKVSEAAYKIRQGMPIGAKVTLRGSNMYSFLERVVFIALPRIRDFSGFSLKNFDGNGNISFGIHEQIIFPEIEYDKIDAIRGMDITVVTSTSSNEIAMHLLSKFHIPFIEMRKNNG